ncbi:MAG: hypothetical protein JNL97_14225 [Verrucomicrobiales bacterium]|nr:hypothetical protein [Verrucomicrobiales bacterium]
MNSNTANESEGFEAWIADPRPGLAEEEAVFMPTCDGGAWPSVGTSDTVGRQQIEFLAVYFRLNRLHARLRGVRGSGGGSGGDEAAIVALLHRGIEIRDDLEDRCAPVGFDAEPTMNGPFAVDVVFRHARRQVPENHRRLHPMVARVQIPLPDPGSDADPHGDVSRVPGIDPATVLRDLDFARFHRGEGSSGS